MFAAAQHVLSQAADATEQRVKTSRRAFEDDDCADSCICIHGMADAFVGPWLFIAKQGTGQLVTLQVMGTRV